MFEIKREIDLDNRQNSGTFNLEMTDNLADNDTLKHQTTSRQPHDTTEGSSSEFSKSESLDHASSGIIDLPPISRLPQEHHRFSSDYQYGPFYQQQFFGPTRARHHVIPQKQFLGPVPSHIVGHPVTEHSPQQYGQQEDNVELAVPSGIYQSLQRTIPSALAPLPSSPIRRVFTGEPYAQLIFKALRSAPDNRMVLKDIYSWFELNTDKAQDPSSNGWKNSIRHNLSMNAAFHKITSRREEEDGRKSNVWGLSSNALLRNGVESTTRFRKTSNKKGSNSLPQYRIAKPAASFHLRSSLNDKNHHSRLTQLLDDSANSMDIKQEPFGSSSIQRLQTSWPISPFDLSHQNPFDSAPPIWLQNHHHLPAIGNQHVFGHLPPLNFSSQPFKLEPDDYYPSTQRNTPEDDPEIGPPTPGMTATASSFGYYDENQPEQGFPTPIDWQYPDPESNREQQVQPRKSFENSHLLIRSNDDIATSIETPS